MTISVAVCSAWHVHAREYAEQVQEHPNATISAVWDDNAERGQALAAQLGAPYEPDVETALANADAVTITSPTTGHAEILSQCARAGKPIFTEKVLTAKLTEGKAVAEIIANAGVHFAISFPHRGRASNLYAKELVNQGRLGQITTLRFHNAHDGASAGWLPAHFYDPAECGAGAMLDLGCHGMYLTAWLLGMPQEVSSIFTKVTGQPVDDNCITTMGYENGAIASNETSFVAHAAPTTLVISGTNGTLYCGGPEGNVYLREKGDDSWTTITDLPDPEPCGVHQWLDSISSGDSSSIQDGLTEALQLTAMMEAAYESWETGKIAAVPSID